MSRSTDPRTKNDEQDAEHSGLPEATFNAERVRSMALSERPTPSSSASVSVLSLANAHVADVAAESSPVPLPPSSKRTLSDRPSPVPEMTHPADTVAEMRDRFSLGDYTGALDAAELLLTEFPEHVEAKRCADNCRSVLEQMYAARIGPLERVPHVAVPRDKLQWLSIDHRAGFVLSHVDGVSSLQMIMAACGMPLLDVLRIVHELVHSRVIAFR